MPVHIYEPPVNELLHYGPCQGFQVKEWPNYVQELGLTREHVPALIQMVQDEVLWGFFMGSSQGQDDHPEADVDPEAAMWAPLHAWRSLGQLQAVDAIPALVQVLDQYDIDWCWEELPQVFGLMGAEAIAPLNDLFATKLHYNHKITVVDGLGEIVKAFPELRDRCVAVLTQQLSNCKQHHRSVNGALVARLMDFEALEAVPVIEAAYQAKKVDEMFVGSWARVQVDLGLKQESDFTPDELAIHYTPRQEQMLANIRARFGQQSASPKSASGWPETYGLEKPPEFKDIVPPPPAQQRTAKPGFGGGAPSGAKKSKKKKN